MEAITELKENWITRKTAPGTYPKTVLMITILVLGALTYIGNYFNADAWMSASGESVFQNHEYWRLWSTLFAHGDLGHIMGNLFLFAPFAFFLIGHFSAWYFPLLGFLMGGIVNYFVLMTMPAHIELIGASGVVYWMGASWMTLSFLIDRRESMKKRIVKVIGVSMILFLPDSLRPNVSYLSHFLGYVLGAISGAIVYLIKHRAFQAAEVWETHFEDDSEPEEDDPSDWNHTEA